MGRATPAPAIETRTMYLTRESASSLMFGGLGRTRLWFAMPTLREYQEELGGLVFTRKSLHSDAGHVLGKLLLKLDDVTGATAWAEVCKSFPGIDYEHWHVREPYGDHPGCIPETEWIGELLVSTSLAPFAGAVRLPLVLTGPFGENARWTGDKEAGIDDLWCWYRPPRFQEMVDYPPCPFTGSGQHPHWTGNGFSEPPRLKVSQLRSAGLSELVKGIDRVIEAEFGRSSNAVVGRPWSRTFDAWIRITARDGSVVDDETGAA